MLAHQANGTPQEASEPTVQGEADAASQDLAPASQSSRPYRDSHRPSSFAGTLFAFEGLDSAARTTLSMQSATWAANQGVQVQHVSLQDAVADCDNTIQEIGRQLDGRRHLHLDPLASHLLHLAAQVEVIDREIQPALAAGKVVFLDGYWWSTCISAESSGLTPVKVKLLETLALAIWASLDPTRILLLDSDMPYGAQPDLFASAGHRDTYRKYAAKHPNPQAVSVIHNPQPLNQHQGHLQDVILHHLPNSFQPTLPLFDNETHHPLSHLLPAQTTPLYDTYWRFANERQRIFFARLSDAPPPWTKDSTLAEYKFTNAYRASDRVSQYLLSHVIYRKDLPHNANELFFRTMLFKLFNKPATWSAFEQHLGEVTWETYDHALYDALLSRLLATGQSIYSSAYIMPPANRHWGYQRKHQGHLALLEQMMKDRVPERLVETHHMQEGYKILASYPSIGPFLAYQFITDLNYTDMLNYDEMDFVVAGPGALSGLQKCFSEFGGLSTAELIRLTCEQQNFEFSRLNLDFLDLWGRPLQLIDCQNLFCEIDKYARVARPELTTEGGRHRIKHRFRPSAENLSFWYPPKWGLNGRLTQLPQQVYSRIS